MVKDIYNAVSGFQKKIQKLSKDTTLNNNNRTLFLKWIKIKEIELKRRKGSDESAKIRYSKTLSKYITLLKGTDKLFNHKDLTQITELDISNLYDDLEEKKIKMAKGTRKDYYNKIFKSDFFEFIGKKEMAKKIIKLESSNDEEVKFFEFDDLKEMVKFTNNIRNKLFLYFLFDTGVRIGTALNIKISDCELKHNIETKRDYYLIHIKPEYTKSKKTDHIPLMIDKTNDYMKNYITDKKNNDLLFNFGYTNARVLIKRVSDKAKIKTKPDNKNLSIHDFRKSCATYFLSKGYSIDFIKARLSHLPSSNAIDRYVSYLGIKENKNITMAQSLEYNELQKNYKEAIERIKILNANQEMIQKNNIKMMELVKKNIKKSGQKIQNVTEQVNELAKQVSSIHKISIK